MFSIPEFSNPWSAAGFLLSAVVAVAAALGFGDFELSTNATVLIAAIVQIVMALRGLYLLKT